VAAIDRNEPEASRLATFMSAQGAATQNCTMASNKGAVIALMVLPGPASVCPGASPGLGLRSAMSGHRTGVLPAVTGKTLLLRTATAILARSFSALVFFAMGEGRAKA